MSDITDAQVRSKSAATDRVLEARPDDFRRACLDDLKTRPEYLALPED